jgi:DNA-directed RNA polymerase sigma subunit (sigma70/sigma32)
MDVAYPTVLARYAVAQIQDGRRVGSRLNVRDVLSPYAQKHKGIHVERLDHFDREEDQWIEAVVEDSRTPVPDQVAFRCDFPAWLETLPRRNRRIAKALSLGHTTSEVAKRFQVSAGRISQLRREMQQSWRDFHGEANVETSPPDLGI